MTDTVPKTKILSNAYVTWLNFVEFSSNFLIPVTQIMWINEQGLITCFFFVNFKFPQMLRVDLLWLQALLQVSQHIGSYHR